MLKTPITFCNFFFIWFTSFQRKCNQKQKKDNSIQIVNSPFLVKIKRSKLVIFKLPLSDTRPYFLSRDICIGIMYQKKPTPYPKPFYQSFMKKSHEFKKIYSCIKSNRKTTRYSGTSE